MPVVRKTKKTTRSPRLSSSLLPTDLDTESPRVTTKSLEERFENTQGGLLIPDSVFTEAQAFNERHRAILEDPANDPMKRENWDRKPAADGNKAIWTYKPFIGLK